MCCARRNAADAVVAGCLTQATVQIDMTNHTGTVCALYFDARTGTTHYLNSMGTLHPTLPPFHTFPPGMDGLAQGEPIACLPGFMPGVAALHERFGSKPWKPGRARDPVGRGRVPGRRVHAGDARVGARGEHYFPAMRELYAPGGFTPSVGEKLRNPALAVTLRRLAEEGPDYFTAGDWAQHFVATANQLGWQIELGELRPRRRARHSRCAIATGTTRSSSRRRPNDRACTAALCSPSSGTSRSATWATTRSPPRVSITWGRPCVARTSNWATCRTRSSSRCRSTCGCLTTTTRVSGDPEELAAEGRRRSTRHVELTSEPALLRAFGWQSPEPGIPREAACGEL